MRCRFVKDWQISFKEFNLTFQNEIMANEWIKHISYRGRVLGGQFLVKIGPKKICLSTGTLNIKGSQHNTTSTPTQSKALLHTSLSLSGVYQYFPPYIIYHFAWFHIKFYLIKAVAMHNSACLIVDSTKKKAHIYCAWKDTEKNIGIHILYLQHSLTVVDTDFCFWAVGLFLQSKVILVNLVQFQKSGAFFGRL